MENKMEEMNNAPFKIGDRVVCVIGSEGIVKGQIYIIHGLYFMSCCKRWIVSVGIRSSAQVCYCPDCCVNHDFMRNWTKYLYSFFALAQLRHEDVAIDEAILEQARELIDVKETVAPVGEPVNN